VPTVFSHIIQKRLSQENENVATEALAYVLRSSEAARRGMMKFLCGIVPDLPPLWFETQQREGEIRPDMRGFTGTETRAFVENKFWAGLTDNQPVSYLTQLAASSQPTILLVVAPAAREQTLWRELSRRLRTDDILASERDGASGMARSVTTQRGPVLALTSWTDLLSALKRETVDDPDARADLAQLAALCDAADDEAFAPVSGVELSDQRTPAFILQLGSIVQKAVDVAEGEKVDDAVAQNVLNIKPESGSRGRLNPQHSWERIGRYVRIPGKQGAGAWFGIHFGLWKSHGATPLWLVFADSEFGRAPAVSRLIEPWAAKHNISTATNNGEFAIGLDIAVGEEEAGVIRSLVDDLKRIAGVLAALPPTASVSAGP
jgi:hypothetical protein